MRKVLSNIVSLMASDVVTRITSFVIYILVGRYLGTFALGQISLALSIFYTFQLFAVAGLKILIVREVAKDEGKVGEFFVNSSFMVSISSLLSLGIVVALTYLLGYHQQYPPLLASENGLPNYVQLSTAMVIILTCLSLLPFALSQICEGVFQGMQHMTFIAYVNVPANVVRIALIVALITSGHGLYAVLLVLLISHILVLMAMWALLWSKIIQPKLHFDFSFINFLFRQSLTFLGIDMVVAITSSLYLILLSYFLNETSVGLYSSALQLVTPFFVISQSIVVSTFPILCQHFEDKNRNGMVRMIHNLLEILMVIFLPSIILVFFYAEWGLNFVYGGEDFSAAGIVLRIIIIMTLIRSMTNVIGAVLLASLLERVTFRIVITELILNLVVGVVLIPRYGLNGAAWGSLIVMAIIFVQHLIPVVGIIKGISILGLVWKASIASVAMLIFLNLHIFTYPIFDILSAGILYLVVLAVLIVMKYGSLEKVRLHYLG